MAAGSEVAKEAGLEVAKAVDLAVKTVNLAAAVATEKEVKRAEQISVS